MAKGENKTQPTDVSVDAFLETVENEVRRRDAETLIAIMREVSGKEPVMWGPSIIGFGTVHYRYESGREGDMPEIGFSPRKANQVLYLMSGFDGYDDLLMKLGPHKTSKACLYITRLDKVDINVLRQLIGKSFVAVQEMDGCEARGT